MSEPMVQVERDGGIAVVRMSDAASNNALSGEMVATLEAAFVETSADESVRVTVLAGLPDYFSSGASREVLESILDGGVAPRDLLLPRVVLDAPKPVIAAMEGHAIGGGLALGLCADMAVIARESRYGANFMNYGFTPGMGITSLLEYTVGPMLSHELLMTGELVKGRRFESREGFNAVLPRAEVFSRAIDIALRIAEKPPAATMALKTVLSAKKRSLFESARSSEIVMHELTFPEESVREAIRDLFGGFG